MKAKNVWKYFFRVKLRTYLWAMIVALIMFFIAIIIGLLKRDVILK